LIQKAVETYGEVYFCTADRIYLYDQQPGEYDERYLTPEGKALLKSCIQKGIIKKEWAKHP
jgi:hypothetical protein